jgi:pyruvate formate lyase activating enzyme
MALATPRKMRGIMEFKGFQKTSLIEYPGKIVSVAFVGGCNFRCPFCQNSDLVLNFRDLPSISEEEVIECLVSRRKWLDGLSITGGEPTIYKDLPDFTRRVREKGFLLEVETNGTNPTMIKDLIKDNVVSYIALDIKAPLVWDKYKEAAGIEDKDFFERVKETVRILLNSNVDYEFRTTVVPKLLSEEDIMDIATQIKGAKRYALQQFRGEKTLDKSYERIKPYPKEKLEKIKAKIKDYFETCEIRGV